MILVADTSQMTEPGGNAQVKSIDTSSLKENLTASSPQNIDDAENDSSKIIPKV